MVVIQNIINDSNVDEDNLSQVCQDFLNENAFFRISFCSSAYCTDFRGLPPLFLTIFFDIKIFYNIFINEIFFTKISILTLQYLSNLYVLFQLKKYINKNYKRKSPTYFVKKTRKKSEII